MNRREFMEQMGLAAIIAPVCGGILSACSKTMVVPSAPTNIDFTVDISTGALSQNGGYLVKNGVIVARTLTGNFLALSATCTHQGTAVQYVGSQNDFYCPHHGALFNATGQVTRGPASQPLAQYSTSLSGNALRVFS